MGRTRRWVFLPLALALGAGLLSMGSARATQTRKIDFNRDIRPILTDRCYACHGPDATSKRIRLRLDSEAAARADLGGGRHAVIPGQPAESELVNRVTAADDAMRMPPVSSGKSLTPAEIALLTEWVRQGAAFQTHWAFVPPVRPVLPAVRDRAWPRNPIDAFVLARLEREGLTLRDEGDVAVESLMAGCDAFLLCRDVERQARAEESLGRAIADRPEVRARFIESIGRVRRFRATLSWPCPDRVALAGLPAADNQALRERLLRALH